MNAYRDENNRPTIIATSTDGTAIVRAVASSSSHRLSVDDGTSGSDNGNNSGIANLDQNSVPVWTALSSVGDGTLVEVYADPVTGKLLVNSN